MKNFCFVTNTTRKGKFKSIIDHKEILANHIHQRICLQYINNNQNSVEGRKQLNGKWTINTRQTLIPYLFEWLKYGRECG